MSKCVLVSPDNDIIAHVGNKNSGRYPRGSGENPFQHIKNARARRKAAKIAKLEQKAEAAREKARYKFEKQKAKHTAGKGSNFLDPGFVWKYRDFYSDSEIQSIGKRIETLNKIRDSDAKWNASKKAGKGILDKVDKTIKTINSAEATVEKVVKVLDNPTVKSLSKKLGFDYTSMENTIKDAIPAQPQKKKKK